MQQRGFECPLAALAAAATDNQTCASCATDTTPGAGPEDSTAPNLAAPSPREKRQSSVTSADSSNLAVMPACWGAQLRGDVSHCTPGFTGGTAHFKNKFCAACKTGTFEIQMSHIRAMPRSWYSEDSTMDVKLSLSNGHSVGFWKVLPDGDGFFRFVNNTLDCDGPQLVVFREVPALSLAWGTIPDRWIDEDKVTLQVAKGTLVPRVSMKAFDPDMWRNHRGRVSLSAANLLVDGRATSEDRAAQHAR